MGNRRGNNGKSGRLYFPGSKVTADGDCSYETTRHLLLGRKTMTNLDSILKSRDITLPTKVYIVKAMVIPIVMYGCWEFLGLQGDLTSWSYGISILNVHWKDWHWSWSSNTLDIWCKQPIYWKRPRCWERLRAGEEGDDRRRDGWLASLTQWIWVWAGSRRWWRTGKPGMLQFMGSQRVGHNCVTVLNCLKFYTQWIIFLSPYF